ncbi:MAG: hypothetical protein ACI4J0_04585 [Huintestinicola sp.]|uniref:hypothetical protein n=1 Tax=Huintestinicola sp. TaxID=2981661 RepID=UPI003F0DB80E
MKVYKIECCEGYRVPFYSDYNSLSILDAGKMLWKEELDFNGGLPFKFDFCHYEHKKKGKILGDFMHTNLTELWVVNEKSKIIIQQKYGEFIWFFPLESTDEQGNKYYSFLPSKYIEGLDVERLEFDEDHNHIQLFDGIYNISDISKYCFKDFVKDYPIFRIKQSGFDQNKGRAITICEPFDIFALDEFVQFVKENNLTGFNFQKVYDDESDIAYEKLPSVPSAPVTGNQQKIKKTHYTGKYKIPFRHENGIYKLSSIEVPEGDGFIFELDGNCILSRNNDYTVYDIGDCNVPKCTEITYWDGKLFSVYINTEKGKLPIYLTFDFSGGKEPETLGQAINECIEVCCNDFINSLEKAEKPLCPVAVEYYYDGEQMSINLQDENSRIYNVGAVARHMVRCICICAGEQCLNNNNMNYETFERILNGLYNRLLEEIPKQFDVTNDFKLYEPEMYD